MCASKYKRPLTDLLFQLYGRKKHILGQTITKTCRV